MEINIASQPVSYIYALTDPRETDGIKRIRYIGMTKNVAHRFRSHLQAAKRGIRRYCYTWIRSLVSAGLFPKYETISVVNDSDAYSLEQETIARFKFLGAPLTNLADGGAGPLGVHRSLETRAKISAATIGNKNALGHRLSDECRANISAVNVGNKNALGHRHSEETRRKLSVLGMGNKNALGHHPSEEVRAKMMGNKHCLGKKNGLGHHHSEEARARISAAHMGKKFSPEHRANLSASGMGKRNLLGHHHSEETRAKLSAAMMGKKGPLGYRHSEATRARMSAAQMGNKKWLGHRHSEESRLKIGAASRGRVVSPETRAKLSAARRAYWAAKKAGLSP